jgi:uncharacterized protein
VKAHDGESTRLLAANGARPSSDAAALTQRIGALPWDVMRSELDRRGFAHIEALLEPDECETLRALYSRPERFRSRVVMASHGFGRGEYRYFEHPLPPLVDALRSAAYGPLVDLANGWAERLASARRFPANLPEFLAQCHAAGQTRPTPLLLQYGSDDYNCLHQDVYGEVVFPLQLAVLLSRPGADFSGGEFVVTEQRPRMQSRAEVIPLALGDAVIFAVRHRPVRGTRGDYRVNMRHGVSRVRSGSRTTLGVIFHDAA